MSQLESLFVEGYEANGHSAEAAKAAAAKVEAAAKGGYSANGELLALVLQILKSAPQILPYLSEILPLWFDPATIAKYQRFFDILKLLFPQPAS